MYRCDNPQKSKEWKQELVISHNPLKPMDVTVITHKQSKEWKQELIISLSEPNYLLLMEAQLRLDL